MGQASAPYLDKPGESGERRRKRRKRDPRKILNYSPSGVDREFPSITKEKSAVALEWLNVEKNPGKKVTKGHTKESWWTFGSGGEVRAPAKKVFTTKKTQTNGRVLSKNGGGKEKASTPFRRTNCSYEGAGKNSAHPGGITLTS